MTRIFLSLTDGTDDTDSKMYDVRWMMAEGSFDRKGKCGWGECRQRGLVTGLTYS